MTETSSIEIFSGAGGLAIGLEAAGFEHTALIERDHYSCKNIRLNIENGYELIKQWNVIEADIRQVDYSGFGTGICLVAGGPPCQPFSLGGKHKAHDDERDMFPEAVRAIRELKPKAFVFENVKGLMRKSFASYFNYILLQLKHPDHFRRPDETLMEHMARLEKGYTGCRLDGTRYKVVFRLVNAADYGVPQIRHRVIMVGFRSDVVADWSFPEATHSKDALLYAQWVTGEYWDQHEIPLGLRPSIKETDKAKVTALKGGRVFSPLISNRWKTVRDALSDLPDPRDHNISSRVPNHQFRKGARAYIGHTGSVMDMPSKALKAGDHGVPGGENAVITDDGSIRYYTVRESARIQTFPDDYIFYGNVSENMRQIGNAVPVDLAATVGRSVLRHLIGV